MTKSRGRLILAVCVLVTSTAVAAVGIPVGAVDVNAVDGLTLGLMSKYHVPGTALALIKDDHIVLEKGYGFRDLEARVPVTIRTLFNIGSISKSFTALDIGQLVDKDGVDLDAPVIRYLPEFRLSDPRVTRAVTLRQLLSHATGLPPDEEWPRQVPATRPEIIRKFATIPITAPPWGRGFNTAAAAWCSLRTFSSALRTSLGKRTLALRSLRHWGCTLPHSRPLHWNGPPTQLSPTAMTLWGNPGALATS